MGSSHSVQLSPSPVKDDLRLRSPENKVLPVPPKGPWALKSTNNGAILHGGGTLSRQEALRQHRKSRSEPSVLLLPPHHEAPAQGRKKSKAPAPPSSRVEAVPGARLQNFEKNRVPAPFKKPSTSPTRSKSLERSRAVDRSSFKEAIMAAYRKRSEKFHVKDSSLSRTSPSVVSTPSKEPPPKQYYFTDIDILKPKEPSSNKPTNELPTYPKPANKVTKAIISRTYVASDQAPCDKKMTEFTNRNLQTNNHLERCNGSSTKSSHAKDEASSLSWSDDEPEFDVRIKPVLPKKRPQYHKISPTQIWRSINTESEKSVVSSDEQEPSEERITRMYRPIAPRRNLPDNHDYSFSNMEHNKNKKNLKRSEVQNKPPERGVVKDPLNWIPQQDIDDSDCGDSPQDGAYIMPPTNMKVDLPAVFNFSKSLPRITDGYSNNDAHQYFSDKEYRGRRGSDISTNHFNSLRNLKRVFGIRSKNPDDKEVSRLDSNWSLSRSLPDFSNLTSNKLGHHRMTPEPRSTTNWQNGHSQQNGGPRRTFSKNSDDKKQNRNHLHAKNGASKKFSYMSTLKMEERRRIEEKVARQVAEEEKQREREIEWMNRVEDEFRKQRDREKSSIRKQLQMLASKMDNDSSYYSGGKEYRGSQEYHSLPSELPHVRQTSYSSQSDLSADMPSQPVSNWQLRPPPLQRRGPEAKHWSSSEGSEVSPEFVRANPLRNGARRGLRNGRSENQGYYMEAF